MGGTDVDHTLFNIFGFIVSWMLLGILVSRNGIDSRTDDERTTW